MTIRRSLIVLCLLSLPLIAWYVWTTSPSYWLKAKIEEYDAQEVWQFQHNGQSAYFIRSGCCDNFDPIFSASGKYICSPSGGLEGIGDNECPTTALADSGTQITRIWSERNVPGERIVAPPLNIPQPRQQDARFE